MVSEMFSLYNSVKVLAVLPISEMLKKVSIYINILLTLNLVSNQVFEEYEVGDMKSRYFDVVFLEQAIDFLNQLDLKTRKKIYYSLDRAKLGLDPRLLKKLTVHIWEFRIRHNRLQYRLFAFWDRSDKSQSLVICSHGMLKKTGKVSGREIKKAMRIRTEYFNEYYGD